MTLPRSGTLYDLATLFVREVGDMGLASYSSDDLRQDTVAWMLAHPKLIATTRQSDGTYRATWMLDLLRRAMFPVVAQQRQSERTPQRTASTYDEAMLELVIPVVWDPRFTPQPLVDASQARASGDNHDAFERWMVMVADLKRAYRTVRNEVYQRELTAAFRYFYLGETYREVGEALDVSRSTAQRLVEPFVDAMLTALNGPPPADRPMRKVISNVTARALTSANYESGAA